MTKLTQFAPLASRQSDETSGCRSAHIALRQDPYAASMKARPAIPGAATTGAFDGQLALKIPAEHLAAAIEPEDAEHGAVFTRRWVVELILDLAGYTADQSLDRLTAIEPACGHGAFLIPMVARLSEVCRRNGRSLREAAGAIRAFDLQPGSVTLSRKAVAETLVDAGWPTGEARHFAESSVQQGDFLLQEHAFDEADFVLGNPPYIRLEAIPSARSEAYRQACRTMAGRADVYVGFIEVGLKALKAEGTLAFICADRWMRNQYGRLLRDLVANHFSFEAAIEMHDVDAFAEEVSVDHRHPKPWTAPGVRRGGDGRLLGCRCRKSCAVARVRTVGRGEASHYLPGHGLERLVPRESPLAIRFSRTPGSSSGFRAAIAHA